MVVSTLCQRVLIIGTGFYDFKTRGFPGDEIYCRDSLNFELCSLNFELARSAVDTKPYEINGVRKQPQLSPLMGSPVCYDRSDEQVRDLCSKSICACGHASNKTMCQVVFCSPSRTMASLAETVKRPFMRIELNYQACPPYRYAYEMCPSENACEAADALKSKKISNNQIFLKCIAHTIPKKEIELRILLILRNFRPRLARIPDVERCPHDSVCTSTQVSKNRFRHLAGRALSTCGIPPELYFCDRVWRETAKGRGVGRSNDLRVKAD